MRISVLLIAALFCACRAQHPPATPPEPEPRAEVPETAVAAEPTLEALEKDAAEELLRVLAEATVEDPELPKVTDPVDSDHPPSDH